jgi:hypothetical protein
MKKNSKRRSSRSNHRGALCALFGGFISIGFLLFSQQLVAVEIASFHDRVLATYNFAPHSVTKEEISAKSKTLDTFWTEVKANQATDLPALREELARPRCPHLLRVRRRQTAPLAVQLTFGREYCTVRDKPRRPSRSSVHGLFLDRSCHVG